MKQLMKNMLVKNCGGTWTDMRPDFCKNDQTNFKLWNGLEST